MSAASATGRFLHFIRFSHTLFALPFALGSMLVAAGGMPSLRVFGLILLCMVFARTAAMTFNRLTDWEYDKRNPRTSGRHHLTRKSVAIVACVLSSLLFLGSAAAINHKCALLSPVALVIVFFYSLTKRFTHFAQFFLGFALAVAPVGAWLAVTGQFATQPFILAAGVLFWVAGFDTIYATQDLDFDRDAKLRSLAVWLGLRNALRLAVALHLVAFLCFVCFGVVSHLGKPYYVGLGVMLAAFIYEHRVAREKSVGAINRAFFNSNAIVSFAFVISIALAIVFP